MKGAAICAALGGAAHWAAARVDLSGGLRGMLVSMDLLDQDAPPAAAAGPEGAGGEAGGAAGQPASDGWWDRLLPYLPLRKFSDEEWEAYKAAQDEIQRKRWVGGRRGALALRRSRGAWGAAGCTPREPVGTASECPACVLWTAARRASGACLRVLAPDVRRIEAALAGGLPVMVERQRQAQQQPQQEVEQQLQQQQGAQEQAGKSAE